MDASVLVAVSAGIAAAGTVCDAAELIAGRVAVEAAFLRPLLATTTVRGGRALAPRIPVGVFVGMQAVRGVAAVLAAAGFAVGNPAVGGAAAALVVIIHVAGLRRLVLGLDGADQMYTVVWFGLGVAAVSPHHGLLLIGGQVILSYLVAGGAKLAGPAWRSGTAVTMIIGTQTHGSAAVSRLLRVGHGGRIVTWATMLFEVTSPALLILGPCGAAVFVVVAAGFHVAVGVTMGLNNFVWAFAAALPAVLFMSDWLQPW